MATLERYLDLAVQTAYEAGRLTLGYFQAGVEAEWKADATPVTIADRKAEELVRRRLRSACPDHAVVGEEYGAEGSDAATHRWIVDPIDGTRAFVRGVPHYAVLLGLEIEGSCQVGAAYFPALDEMIAGATGLGCRWNGRPAHVSSVTHLKDGVVAHANVVRFRKHRYAAGFDRLIGAAGHVAGWADAYAYLLVATGRAEVALDPVMSPWDCAPFPPILAEAGGYFGDWDGNVTIRAREAMATTALLLPEVLGLVRPGT
jgi:myo-inositol-1(or 4)-monophosphatase